MTKEDDDLAYDLQRRYALACKEISWDDPGYKKWAENRFADGYEVYLVWWNDTKPHDVAYHLLKDERPPVGDMRRRVIHCKSQDTAKTLGQILLAPDPFGS
jgi:hypothetical protein